jgi:hypothetical protein
LGLHVPVGVGVQPGQLVQPRSEPHSEQVYAGVPVHDGATRNSCGGTGRPERSILQQIWPVQSLSWWHAFGHESAHRPLQQS